MDGRTSFRAGTIAGVGTLRDFELAVLPTVVCLPAAFCLSVGRYGMIGCVVTRTGEHWAAYNDDQRNRPPRALCEEVIALAGHGEGRQALDIGCGAGMETAALLRAGWRVHAIDSAPGTPERVSQTTGDRFRGEITIETTDLSVLVELPPADLVYAAYSLPFLAPRDFNRVWTMIRGSLRPGAWLAVNLFGERDSWAKASDGTFLAKAAVQELLDGLRIVRLTEEDAPGNSYSGPKHWHVFDVIAHSPERHDAAVARPV